MSFGKFIKKAGSFIGKTANSVDKANKFIGKNISNVERNYSSFKKGAISATPAPFRPLTRDAFFAVEKNPITSAVMDAKDLVKMGSQNVSDVSNSAKLLKGFMR